MNKKCFFYLSDVNVSTFFTSNFQMTSRIYILLILCLLAGGTCFAGENTWTSTGSFGKLEHVVLLSADPSKIYITSGANAYYSSDSGTTWTGPYVITSNPTVTVIESLELNPSNSDTAFALTRENSYRSTDKGQNWVQLAGFPFDYVGGEYGNAIKIFNDPVDNIPRIFISGSGDTLAAVYSVKLSQASGTTIPWTLSSGTVPGVSAFGSNSIDLYSWSYNGIYKYINGSNGYGWQNQGYFSSYLYCHALAGDPIYSSKILFSTSETRWSNYYVGYSRGYAFYSSTDGGATVNRITSIPGYVNAIVFNPANSDIIYAGGAAGVYTSTDGGASWVAMNTGLTAKTMVYGLAVVQSGNDTIIYAATSKGFWSYTVVAPSASSESINVKSYNTIFDPTKPLGERTGLVKIVFEVNTTSTVPVSMKVYNLRGELVRTLIDNVNYFPATHSKDWDGRNDAGEIVASGIYIVNVTSGKLAKWTKVAVLK